MKPKTDRYRSLTIDDKIRATLGEDGRTIELSAASDAIVDMGYYREQLRLENDAIDIYTGDGAAFLWMHNREQPLGRAANFVIDNSGDVKRLRCSVRFDTHQLAAEKLKSVQDGFLSEISVGYRVLDEDEREDEQGEYYYVKRWSLLEVSLVTIPADNKVGIGREAPKAEEVIQPPATIRSKSTMTPEEKAALEAQIRQEASAEIREEIAKRRELIIKLGEQTGAKQEFVNKLLSENPDSEAVRDAYLAESSRMLEEARKIGIGTVGDVDKPSARAAEKPLSLGERFSQSEAYKQAKRDGTLASQNMPVEYTYDGQRSRGITNEADSAGALITANTLPGILTPIQEANHVRTIISAFPTNSPVLEYMQETLPQGRGGVGYQLTQGSAKQETNFTFELVSASVAQLASWVPMTEQMAADVPTLEAQINGRLTQMLLDKEDYELMYGAGTAGTIKGLDTYASAYNTATPRDNKLEVLRYAIAQVTVNSLLAPDAMLMNDMTWAELETSKDSTGTYYFANPQGQVEKRLWGVRVLTSTKIPQDNFLLGNFSIACNIADREQYKISTGYINDQFVRNQFSIRIENRVGLLVYRPAAIMKGTLADGVA